MNDRYDSIAGAEIRTELDLDVVATGAGRLLQVDVTVQPAIRTELDLDVVATGAGRLMQVNDVTVQHTEGITVRGQFAAERI